ncbi:MAG TPA: cache domain-containing protein, partial [Polyangiaceae bacterium]|nr:cache domain-containing protein [Polyangiaceae bacterium]
PACLAAALAKHPSVFEIGVAYEPFRGDLHARLLAPHAARVDGAVQSFELADRYDYTERDWYKLGLKGAAWGEPYFGAATKRQVVGYTEPFTLPGDPTKTVIGVVRVNLALDGVASLVSSVSLGRTGYGYLISGNGTYIAHQNPEYARLGRNAYDVARELKDEQRVHNLDRVLKQREATEQVVTNALTGQSAWLFNQPLALNSWVVSTVSFRDEVRFDERDTRRAVIQVMSWLLLAGFGASVLLFRAYRGAHRELWRATLSAASLLLVGIFVMWALTLRFPDRNGEESVHIMEATALHKFLANQRELTEPAGEQIRIAAGLLVRTMRSTSANDYVITGTVWERIPSDRLPEIHSGLDFPDAESVELRESSTVRQGENELISWNFKVALREPSKWSEKYPFDRALIRIRMTPKPSKVPVVLVPDLLGYQLLTPGELPGVEKALALPGWALDHSYFSFLPRAKDYNTALLKLQNQPLPYVLSFNIVTQRRFLDPFIASVLPLIVIFSLLYGLLIVGSKVSTKVAATGFKATDVLRASVGLLFPALIAQVNLRTKIGATEIIYIEYFYFILYAAILGVAANALTFTLSREGVSQVRDNLVPKLLYWPLVLGMCFALTFVFLY